MLARFMIIFVAKINIETEPLRIMIVAVCRDISLCQPPEISVSEFWGYVIHRIYPYSLYRHRGDVIQVVFIAKWFIFYCLSTTRWLY